MIQCVPCSCCPFVRHFRGVDLLVLFCRLRLPTRLASRVRVRSAQQQHQSAFAVSFFIFFPILIHLAVDRMVDLIYLPIPKRPNKLKQSVINFYYGNVSRSFSSHGVEMCFVTGEWGTGAQVKVAHICPRRTPDTLFNDFCLRPEDRDNARNMMMLAANLEPALDRKQISFIETKESMEHPEIRVRQYQMKVWDKKILDFCIWQDLEHKVQEYDGHVFSFPLGNGPFTRVLSCQAQLCYNIAVKQGWVSQDYDRPQEFGTPVRDVFTTPIANRTFDSRDSPRSCRSRSATPSAPKSRCLEMTSHVKAIVPLLHVPSRRPMDKRLLEHSRAR